MHHFGLHKKHWGSGIFSHVHDIKGRKVVEGLNWAWAHWGSEQQEELRYQVTYHMYLASGGRLLYTPSIELVVGWTVCETLLFHSQFFGHLLISSYSHEKRHQALPAFPYCKRQKAGRGLGVRLAVSKVGASSPDLCTESCVRGWTHTDTIRQQ